MICPNCNNICNPQDHFCYRCGTDLTRDSHKPAKKGTHWIPALIMAVLAVIGTVLFFLLPSSPSDSPDMPAKEIAWFRVEDGTLYFLKEYYSGSEELVIPRTVDGQIVTALSDGCFQDCSAITTVILPDTLKIIGASAFENCSSLRGMNIPESVTVIGPRAFYDCFNLEAIHLTNSVTKIGFDAFAGCNELFYIFFSGSHSQWESLYSGFINIYTGVVCDDGTFYQGGKPY